MADFDFSTLITDRGQSDLATLRSVLSTPMEEWTAEQLAAFNLAASKGAYNYTDLNRVTAAMDNLNERLTELGYQTGYQPIIVHPKEPEPVNPLPEGYTQVAWIESTGSQYINTGYTIQSEEMKVVLQFAYTGVHSDSTLFGSETSGLTGAGEYSICPHGLPEFYVGGSKKLPAGYTPQINETCILAIEANQGVLTDTWNDNVPHTQNYINGLNHTYPIFIFSNNISAVARQFASIKLFSFALYDSGNLVRNFVPCISPNGAAGLYDLVNGQFYGNQGTGSFFASPANISLPDGYRQVEYIESSGTQWINTGVPVEAGSGFSLDFRLVSTSGNIGMIGGFDYGRYNNNFGAITGRWGAQYGINKTYFFGTVDTNRHKVEQNIMPGLVVFDGAQVVGELIFYDITDRTFNLFCYNGGPSYPTFWIGSMRIYSCVIYENGTVLRNYIPCINPSNEAGLYDLVHAQFYGNDGAGTFTAGIEIDPPVPDPEPSLDAYTWYESDVPTESTMAGYLANVAALRGVLTLPENTAEVPADMAGLTLADANAIEEILLVIEDYLMALASVFRRCGAAICGGPGFYFVN